MLFWFTASKNDSHTQQHTHQHGKQAVPVIVKQYLCSIEEICVELGGPKELQEVNDELFSNLIPTHLDVSGERFCLKHKIYFSQPKNIAGEG